MIKKIKALLILPLLCFTAIYSASGAIEKIKLIDQNNYFTVVGEAVKNAKESIIIVMPYIQKTNEAGEVSKLLDKLANSAKRNVTVKIYLDMTTTKDVLPGGYLHDIYNFCKKNRIFIFFDYPNVHANNRVIVIDSSIVIGGSAVLSDTITNNTETCFYIESPELAKLITENINSIAVVSDPSEKRDENFAYIPESFIKNNSSLIKILQRNDKESLDVYLVLARDYNGNKVDTDYSKILDGMDISRNINPHTIKRKINSALKKLARTYGAIKINIYKNKKLNIKIIQNPGENMILLPKTYWDFRWHKELSINAKALLLVTCNIVSFKRNSFDLKFSKRGLKEVYSLNNWIINAGLQELFKHNILAVSYTHLTLPTN